jgi:hypothetical protein
MQRVCAGTQRVSIQVGPRRETSGQAREEEARGNLMLGSWQQVVDSGIFFF